MADYDRLVAEQTLFSKLRRGRMSGEYERWVPASDVRAMFSKRSSDAS